MAQIGGIIEIGLKDGAGKMWCELVWVRRGASGEIL
jgi:hypothetical protein